MDSGRGKTRKTVEGDRLSSLPDDLIHKILAFIDIKQAIETGALSSRWRHVWTSVPCLNFSSKDFRSLPEFSKFVSHVLSAQNNQAEVHSVNITFRGKTTQVFVKRILHYAFSHNVQQMNITCLPRKTGSKLNLTDSPLSVYISQTLKKLTLSGYSNEHYISNTPSWYLPALTTLTLYHVLLYVEDTPETRSCFFSNCANLKSLTLKNCRLDAVMNGFDLFHHGISNLTLEDSYEDVNVVMPQLKNLTIINWSRVHLVSTPNLASLRYIHDTDNNYGNPLKVSTDLLHLEKVDVCIQCYLDDEAYTHQIVCLLQQLHSAKFLSLNLELVKLLSSSGELLSHQPSPFTNLKSLKIYPADVTQPEVTMPTKVKNYLLDSSQGATFTLVSYEEVRAVVNTASAQSYMRELQVLLDQWTRNSETNTTDIEQDKASMEGHMAKDMKLKWQFGERMTRIESCWGVLTKLPASRRDKLQARFSGLCAEAETIMDNTMDRMKTQCDKKPGR